MRRTILILVSFTLSAFALAACGPGRSLPVPVQQQDTDAYATAEFATAAAAGNIPPAGMGVAPDALATPAVVEPSTVTIVAVGDVMLGRMINFTSVEQDDFTWAFHQTADVLRNADLTIGNLEGTIISDCRPTEVGLLFCADPRSVDGLLYAGFDGVSLANNHSLDKGETGFEETAELLRTGGIVPFYDDQVMIRQINGIRIAIFGYDDESRTLPNTAIEAIEELAPQFDIVIGMLHWGYEYRPNYSYRQGQVGRALIDAGADIVIGHHPHVVQPVEHYNDGIIFYSLGNFVFDQMWSQETREGHILHLTMGLAENPAWTK